MAANQSFRDELSTLLNESRAALGSISPDAPPRVVEQALIQIQNNFNNTMNEIRAGLAEDEDAAGQAAAEAGVEDELAAEEDIYPED